jgi:hypothetical protein
LTVARAVAANVVSAAPAIDARGFHDILGIRLNGDRLQRGGGRWRTGERGKSNTGEKEQGKTHGRFPLRL